MVGSWWKGAGGEEGFRSSLVGGGGGGGLTEMGDDVDEGRQPCSRLHYNQHKRTQTKMRWEG